MNTRIPNIAAQDLTDAARAASRLTTALGQPLVVAGALAMAVHGYRRETGDVDIVIPVVIGKPSGDQVEDVAREMGMVVRAKHGFGGLDLRDGETRIDVLTLDRDFPDLVPNAVAEAVQSDRRVTIFGQDALAVSLGHLVTMKLVAERRKDIGDIVELIKSQMDSGIWTGNLGQVFDVVRNHLGTSGADELDKLIRSAREERG